MENEILTGRNVNEAKKRVTDEEVNKILKSAQEQLNKEIKVELTNGEREAKAAKMQKEKAEQEAKEKAEQEAKEKAEQEAREKAEQEAKRKAEQEAKRKAEQEAKRKAEQEAKEKAEQEAKRKAEQETKKKAEQEARERETRAARMEKEKEERQQQEIEKEKARQESAAAVVEIEEPYVAPVRIQNVKEDRITVGTVIGTFLETIWTLFKLVVVVSLVVGVVGFFMTRGYVVRGRCGDRQCLSQMAESGTSIDNRMKEKDKVKEWLKGVKSEKLHMESDDGKILVARKIDTNENSHKWVVLLHGFNGSMEDMYDVAMHYTEEGYNILLPDLRANGESEGSIIGMGWLDRLDVINWMDVLIKEDPAASIVIHGVDIGADTALMLSGEPLKSSLKAIVAEGAYDNAWDVVKKEYKARHEEWPTFPVLNMMNPVLKVWAGYSLKEADAVKQVKKTSVPILLIQGGRDSYVTEDMTEQLDAAIASSHEVLTVPDGVHGDCRYADPDTYYNKTFEFIGGYAN